jgi:hypothetical protein
MIAGCIALTGCGAEGDRLSVTLVNRDVAYDRSYFTDWPLVAEVHNTPFDGVDTLAVAGMLRLPSSYADDGAFALASPGDLPRPKVRLVLTFNSRAPQSARDLCAAFRPLGAATPLNKDGYMADIALCRDKIAIASASMTATTDANRDTAFAERSLSHLMLVLFGDYAERAQLER